MTCIKCGSQAAIQNGRCVSCDQEGLGNQDLQDRLIKIVKYCEPYQEYMWAKYIIALALDKKEWRD